MAEIKVEFYVMTNKLGSEVSETLVIEVDDDASEKDIQDAKDEIGYEWVMQNIEWGYDEK
jgi:hypothetical protein